MFLFIYLFIYQFIVQLFVQSASLVDFEFSPQFLPFASTEPGPRLVICWKITW